MPVREGVFIPLTEPAGALDFDTRDVTSFRIDSMNLEGALCNVHFKVNPNAIELSRLSDF